MKHCPVELMAGQLFPSQTPKPIIRDIKMRILKLLLLAIMWVLFGSYSHAAPRVISAMAGGATAYSFFVVDTKRLNGRTIQQVQNELQQQLDANATGLTACWVAGDLNATNINCGNGALRFGNTELYTYNLETNIPGVPFVTDKAIREAQGANFISPNGTVVGDTVGREVRIHFNQRVVQFGMLIDAGAAVAPSVNRVQFIVNRQPVSAQRLVPGVVNFAGVEDPNGFTDVTIISSGIPRSWIADQFSFVPLTAF
ncbi:MAG: hypothetical protein ACR65R_03385 [Methylomicrobium sp.]